MLAHVELDGELFEAYLKIPGVSTGGDTFTVVGAINECVAYLLAKEFDLAVPEALCVELPLALLEAPSYLLSDPVHAFGSRVESGVMIASDLVKPDHDVMIDVYHFDGLAGNQDRAEGPNPNVLVRGNQAFLIDHEFCFPGLQRTVPPEPWEADAARAWLQNHIFRRNLRRSDRLPEWRHSPLDQREIDALLASVPAVWTGSTDGSLHVGVLREYLLQVMGKLHRVMEHTQRTL